MSDQTPQNPHPQIPHPQIPHPKNPYAQKPADESPSDQNPSDGDAPNTDAGLSSGNQWEPDEPHTAAMAPAPARSRFTRARAGIAGVAVVGLLAAGLGGFAVGRATGDDGESGIQQVGFQPGDEDGDLPEGFPGGGEDDRGQRPGSAPEGFDPEGSVPDGSDTDGSASGGSKT